MSQCLLQVQGLHGWYADAHILFGLDLEIRAGEVVALMGRNGAGKSTTLKALMGLLERRQGQIRLAGRDIGKLAPHQRARLGLGYVPEDRRIFTELSVLENLETGRQPPRPGAPHWTPQALFELFPNLGAMPQRLGGRMSGGEQQMLTIARTLMGNPRLLLLDEPSEGVAPVIVEQMAAMIQELKRSGIAILLCEQNLHFASLVCDRGYLLDQGRIVAAGTPASLQAHQQQSGL
ncbi:ABC transporter ATP-binding protein [Herbaspirillum seropedicae]|uniref:ABC-type branched-chain amino acid transport system, ATPase component protein n=1 Tax=Herbaspirillum seropedicae (strain SmR1) TaxID=757424 RepID=D8IWD3_HERSS|nr:ABC transporter ATP-binding protein [Herbaspirillum seropedicae]ADJ63953.1 ABC-type branched-chain amino acid transport system, ATPase component protein [Herbaspirillum seropedicae SmR1]AKN65927.1 ABC transporter [Herbaspirillum seropedicae]NQE29076.1 ABC transporter [Herbaspirillum seropedicae]UMU21911.1 ABC transporter ATP-binding protein [Herbaspirillum seropedicae]